MGTTERKRGAKYMEGYLEFKEASKWVNYWVVIRGPQLFFFKDSNTTVKENIQGHLDLGANSHFASGKNNKGKFEFEVKVDRGKKYLFRANSEADRLQWIYTLGLAAQGKLPPPTLSDCDPETEKSSTDSRITVAKKVSNPYSEVPNFNISPDAAGVTDDEMQKKIVNFKKHNSFSSHCKKLWGLKEKLSNKSVDVEESSRPESEGAEASSEGPLYDEFIDETPPWYFGKITREESEKVLQDYTPGSFLVRNSETVQKPGAYTISLRHREKFRHHKIETLPDGNLVIKNHEDKVFPNLALLMKYFTKSQEKDIEMKPVLCKEPDAVDNGVEAVSGDSYLKMDPRPPVPGCEDRLTPESGSGHISPRGVTKHSYENLPDKQQRAKPPLKSRVTSPDLHKLHGYENLPNKEKLPVGNRTTPLGYELMGGRGAAPGPPGLPPKRPVSHNVHGYENIPEKGEEPLPPRQPASEGYVNLPPRPGRSSSEPPDLPPRIPPQARGGYENVPTRDDSSLRNARTLPAYQNIRPDVPSRSSQGARRVPPPLTRAATVPAHILQNTLGKG
ncbi:hypothetical protein ACROYT_G002014 [Oculina patagonica]